MEYWSVGVMECSRLFFAPKGHKNLAQGFNPGNRISPAKSPERAPDRMLNTTPQTVME
jgi:hypothetical protein